jgi:hypothetical protein
MNRAEIRHEQGENTATIKTLYNKYTAIYKQVL